MSLEPEVVKSVLKHHGVVIVSWYDTKIAAIMNERSWEEHWWQDSLSWILYDSSYRVFVGGQPLVPEGDRSCLWTQNEENLEEADKVGQTL